MKFSIFTLTPGAGSEKKGEYFSGVFVSQRKNFPKLSSLFQRVGTWAGSYKKVHPWVLTCQSPLFSTKLQVKCRFASKEVSQVISKESKATKNIACRETTFCFLFPHTLSLWNKLRCPWMSFERMSSWFSPYRK